MARLFYILNTFLVGFSLLALCLFLDLSAQPTVFFCAISCLVIFLFLFGYQSPLLTLNKRFSWVNLLVIAAISLFSLQEILMLFDQSGALDMIRITPLVICLSGLYFAYWFVNFIESELPGERGVSQLIGGVFSGLSVILAFLMALPVTVFILLIIMMSDASLIQVVAVKFTERGIIPPLTLLIFIWSLILIVNKFVVLYLEKTALTRKQQSSRVVLAFNLLSRHDDQEGSKRESVNYLIDLIWKTSTDFYTLPRYISWAIPILGFIGTVLGISLAAEGIQKILMDQQSAQQMTQHLGDAISPLGIAFDTTLIALSLSVFLVLIQTALQRFEHALVLDIENEFRKK